MAKRKNKMGKLDATAANVGYEAQLWQMADALRGSMDAAEYKHVVLGLIFLKYIADKTKGAAAEDPDDYRAASIVWVLPETRWAHWKAQAKPAAVGPLVNNVMSGIERDNPVRRGVLPKDPAGESLARPITTGSAA